MAAAAGRPGVGQTPAVAVDPQDRVWVFTRAKPEVQIYSAAGEFLRALRPDVGRAHAVRFDPQGNPWLVDVGDHVVMQLSPEGKLLRTLGARGQPGDDATHFNQPTDVAVTPAGEIFVSDGYENSRVVHFDRNGKFVKAVGQAGGSAGRVQPAARDCDRFPRADSTWPTATTSASRCSTQSGNSSTSGDNLLVPWGLWITAGGRDLGLRLLAHGVAGGRRVLELPAQGPIGHAVRHVGEGPPGLDLPQGRGRQGAAGRIELGPRRGPGFARQPVPRATSSASGRRSSSRTPPGRSFERLTGGPENRPDLGCRSPGGIAVRGAWRARDQGKKRPVKNGPPGACWLAG